MPTYQIQGRDYGIDKLMADITISVGVDIKKLRILEEARNIGILSADINQYNSQKIKFLKKHYGWGYLKIGKGDSIPIEDCKPERIHAVIIKELRKLLDSKIGKLEVKVSEVEAAKSRMVEYSRLDTEAFNREKEQARQALENFKAEHPEKYRANVMAALRNQDLNLY